MRRLRQATAFTDEKTYTQYDGKDEPLLMNIFLKELKVNAKPLAIWSVCMFLLIVSGMAKYTSFSSSGQSMKVFLNDMPYSIKDLFGLGSFDMTTIGGYFAMLFLYIELTAAIHAALLGASIISKEERGKTTEFLMVKPISRNTVLTSKLLAALFNIIILNLVSIASSFVAVSALKKGTNISSQICLEMLSMFFVQLIFTALGAALSAALKKTKFAGSISIGVLLGAFIISKITDITNKADFLNVLSPFKYFNLNDILSGKGLNPIVTLLSLLVAAVFCAITYITYNRRDLNI